MSWEVDFSCYGTEQELTASRCYQRNTFKLCLMQTLPSTKCKFLAVTWVDDNLLLFFFSFQKKHRKCPRWQLRLRHEMQLEWPQTKLLDVKILYIPTGLLLVTKKHWVLKFQIQHSFLLWDEMLQFLLPRDCSSFSKIKVDNAQCLTGVDQVL